MKLEEGYRGLHSGPQAFAKVAERLAKHLDGIVAYVATGLSNARSEGTNGKVRTITDGRTGLHGASAPLR
jgi:transposase